MQETNLHDIHGLRHNTAGPVSYQRGKEKIDYMAVYPNVIPSIIACGIRGINAGPIEKYDHRSLFLDINSKTLFGSNTHDAAKTQWRKLRSNNVRSQEEYSKYLAKFCTDKKLFEKIQMLQGKDKLEDHD